MANFAGTLFNQTLPASYGTVSAGDVTLTADSEVTFITTGTIKTNYPGDFYPMIWGVATIYLGGTKPNALTLAFKIGSGSDVATFVVDPGQLVNSAKLVIPCAFVGANSASAWYPTGSTINITALGTAQASTAKNVGTFAIVSLMQGPNI